MGTLVVLGMTGTIILEVMARGPEPIAIDIGPFVWIVMALLAVVEVLLLLPSSREAFRYIRQVDTSP